MITFLCIFISSFMASRDISYNEYLLERKEVLNIDTKKILSDEYSFDAASGLLTIIDPLSNVTSETCISKIGIENFKKVQNISFSGSSPLTTGSEGFINNEKLLEISIKVTDRVIIGDYSFKGCTNLITISFNTIESIGIGAFSFCQSLINIYFNENIKIINSLAFNGTSIENIRIPKCDIIEHESFSNCKLLKTVFIEARAEGIEIDYSAFYECLILKDVYYCSSKPPTQNDIYTEVHELFTYTEGGINKSRSDQVTIHVPPNYPQESKFAEATQFMINTDNQVELGTIRYVFNGEEIYIFASDSTDWNTLGWNNIVNANSRPSISSSHCPCSINDITTIICNGTNKNDVSTSTPGFSSNKKLTKIIFENTGESSVNANSLKDCTNLKEIIFKSQRLFGISGNAISNTGIEEIHLYTPTSFIGTDAFRGCTKLHTIKVSYYAATSNKGLQAGCFGNCPALRSLSIVVQQTHKMLKDYSLRIQIK